MLLQASLTSCSLSVSSSPLIPYQITLSIPTVTVSSSLTSQSHLTLPPSHHHRLPRLSLSLHNRSLTSPFALTSQYLSLPHSSLSLIYRFPSLASNSHFPLTSYSLTHSPAFLPLASHSLNSHSPSLTSHSFFQITWNMRVVTIMTRTEPPRYMSLLKSTARPRPCLFLQLVQLLPSERRSTMLL